MALRQENINRAGPWVNNEIVMPHLAPYRFGRQKVVPRKFINPGES